MIEVDNIRRNLNIGPYEPSFMSQSHPLTGAPVGIPGYDGHRVLVHWHQPPAIQQNPQPPSARMTPATKSDEDDDDDDEERPFTPPPPRERLSYTRYQLELLNGIFEEVRYPNSTQKQLIAKRVGITREQVKIWFQNRRRKDVIGNSGKIKADKSCDTSTCSTGSSTGSSKSFDSRQNSPAPEVNDNESTSSDENMLNSPHTELNEQEQVVPSVVMKSVIGELVKFKNDPLKGKKNKKKKKKTNKKKEQDMIKKGIVSTLISGNYDMVNPPNQVTPTAFFEKLKNGFNHSKNASAFASPRDVIKPAQISSVSSSTESPPISSSKESHKQITSGLISNCHSSFPFGSSPGNFLSPEFGTHFPTPSNSHGCDIPVLSELLTHRPGFQSNKEPSTSSSSSPSFSSAFQTSPSSERRNTDKQPFHPHPGMVPFSAGRPFNGIYPYPFLAEQPMVLSSLRQSDHIFRPAPQYPMNTFNDDPYQPLLITSLSNPYYSPPVSWQATSASTQQTSSSYTQL